MKPKIIAWTEGTTSEDRFFLIIVREGDEAGEYLEEGDEGFAKVAREVAHVKARLDEWVAEYNRQLRQEYEQQYRKEAR